METTNNINIAALLKDCPKGIKLYSPICGECTLQEVHPYKFSVNIWHHGNNGMEFSEYGTLYKNCECLLFPSKEVREWRFFNVKYIKGGSGAEETLIANGAINPNGIICLNSDKHYFIDAITKQIDCVEALIDEIRDYILSTGTELKLEEQPKFKVGDAVKWDNYLNIIVEINGRCVIIDKEPTSMRGSVNMETLTLATPEEIAKWNKEELEPNHLHYSKSKRKIIDWFLPFDKVVERCKGDDMMGVWSAGFFSHYDKEINPCYPYHTVAGMCNECLPYNEKTAKLIGTTDDYKEE